MVRYKPVSDHDAKFEKGDSPGQWQPGPGQWQPVKGGTAVLRCVDCRGLIHLEKNHSISPSGKVSPSIGCPWCGWHVFGTLVGWDRR
jgi:hypothetical protein